MTESLNQLIEMSNCEFVFYSIDELTEFFKKVLLEKEVWKITSFF